jgi:hypothetical protein
MDVILLKFNGVSIQAAKPRLLKQSLTALTVHPSVTMLEYNGKWYGRVVVAQRTHEKDLSPVAYFAEAGMQAVPTIENGQLEFFDQASHYNRHIAPNGLLRS